MTTPTETVTVIGGVDTHKHTHYAAVIDTHGCLLHREFPATGPGYAALRLDARPR
jgi:transposase